MADANHVAMLNHGVNAWNTWRKSHPDVIPDLSGAWISKLDLRGIDFRNVKLNKVRLRKSDLTQADLSDARLQWANLSKTTLIQAKLLGADLNRSTIRWADAAGADFRGANLKYASLVGTNLPDATLDGCRVYGISAWSLAGVPHSQKDLVIARYGESGLTVDDLEIAQFIYHLVTNEKIRHVIDTLTSKVVLILGRFTPERKLILDGIRANSEPELPACSLRF